MGGLSLIPQVVDAVSVPVIAAGGIADGRGIGAAHALGAEAVQIGTAFVSCVGSGASAAYRSALSSRSPSLDRGSARAPWAASATCARWRWRIYLWRSTPPPWQ